jgi:D-alanine-D-alanine ligase
MVGQRKIGVLMGGLSAERDVSIRSGEAIVAALAERGYDAWPLFVDRDIDLVLRQARIDVAFVTLHGRYGEDGCIQGLLELLGIPYTGSGVLASAMAMNKARAKDLFRLNNLPTAPGYVVEAEHGGGEDLVELHGSFGFPVVVKPAGEGSSLGIRIARDELELETAVEEALRFDDDVLVERFIEGKEISVGILDGKPLGAVEIVPKRGFYDFHNKYTSGRTEYHLPARLSPERYRSALRLATMAHEALGCEGATRVDLIVSDKGNEVVLEINTLPGMTPTSLLPKIAHSAGLSFEELVEEMLRGARLRAHGHRRDRRAVQVGYAGPERRAGLLTPAH